MWILRQKCVVLVQFSVLFVTISILAHHVVSSDIVSGEISPADALWVFAIEATSTAVSPSFKEVLTQLQEIRTVQNTASQSDEKLKYLIKQLGTVVNSSLEELNFQQHATENLIVKQGVQLNKGITQLINQLDNTSTILSAGLNDLGTQRPSAAPRDCSDLPSGSSSGVYLIAPGLRHQVPVFCDQDTAGGGWTVLQRRADIQPRQDFFLGWEDYKWGFGVLNGEFWWGLENMWLMTALLDRKYELRVDLEDFDGEKRHALYQGFKIGSEGSGYRLTVVNYTGDAGDSMSGHSGFRFTTKDKDQDAYPQNCATSFKGGWWYEKCHWANLNGLYLAGDHSSYADGVIWYYWKGYHHSFKVSEMKIRPTLKL